jgi:uncharacterized protein (DUF924 family)
VTAWQSVLDWWFGSASRAAKVAAARGALWFGKQDSQDREARERFAGLVEQALAGGLEDWNQQPEGWLAHVLLLDQLPRMIFRDTPRAFAGDSRAQALVREGMAQGWDARLAPIQRVFIYLVLEHTEDLAAQDRAVACFSALRDAAPESEHRLFDDYLDYAERHRQVIARFARFPHRNAILGRSSSATELSFLQEPGSRF